MIVLLYRILYWVTSPSGIGHMTHDSDDWSARWLGRVTGGASIQAKNEGYEFILSDIHVHVTYSSQECALHSTHQSQQDLLHAPTNYEKKISVTLLFSFSIY